MMATTASYFYKSFVCQPKLLKYTLHKSRFYTSKTGQISKGTGCGKFGKAYLIILAGGLACGSLIYALDHSVVDASGLEIQIPRYPWCWNGVIASFDHSAIRRGWQVYKEVCSQCHSLQFVAYRHLVDVCLTEDEAKEIAAESEFKDGPDEEGNFYMRPGKLTDYISKPFENEKAARAANNGALPVDLSTQANYHTTRQHQGADYIFSLLTGYTDPPAGVELGDGQSYNMYFPGGTIGMAEVLQSGLIEYEDGTPATQSQMAKDVAEFLTWTCNMEHDTRKSFILKSIGICSMLIISLYGMYSKRMNSVKNTYICFATKRKPSSDC